MTTTLQAPPPLPHQLQEASSGIIANVSAHAREVERRWGFGVLPRIVPIEWMERFTAQKRKFEIACFEFDHAGIRKHGEAMNRAYEKLEQVATDAGPFPAPLDQWEFLLKDETLVILVRDRADMIRADPKGRAAQIWSLDEVAEIIAKFPVLALAKESFPGAEIITLAPSRKSTDPLDDSLEDLPF